MSLKTMKLNGTAIAVGAAAVSGLSSAAMAQSADGFARDTVKPLTFGAEGGFAWSDYSKDSFGSEKLGDFNEDFGYYGSLSVSRGITTEWDWRLSVNHLRFRPNDVTLQEEGDTAFMETGVRSTMADFDFGRLVTVNGGATDLRFGVGLTAGTVNQSLDKGIEFGSESGNATDADLRFKGIGPRMSADVSHRIGGDSGGFRVIGGAEISPMYGEYEVDKGFTAYDGEDSREDGFSDSQSGRLLRTSAYVGLAFDTNDRTTFKGGIRGTGFSDLSDDRLFEDPTVSYTAFIGMDVRF
ncbi:MAG: hypothetical protein JXQ91_07870 [Vannielia sp.]|uniref:Lpg1974 family pore-forming outer membrane protein n=1 Tax=Vannielia sp. TaxID=2813045 RepID=UPI003B8C8751